MLRMLSKKERFIMVNFDASSLRKVIHMQEDENSEWNTYKVFFEQD